MIIKDACLPADVEEIARKVIGCAIKVTAIGRFPATAWIYSSREK